jgi:hypothetical protein
MVARCGQDSPPTTPPIAPFTPPPASISPISGSQVILSTCDPDHPFSPVVLQGLHPPNLVVLEGLHPVVLQGLHLVTPMGAY